MQIAVLGAGNIGGTLGKKWAQAGHTVRFGVRDPHKPEIQALINELGGSASAVSIGEAIDGADVVLFAIPGGIAAETVAAHAPALNGKILIDATNNMRAATLHNMAAFAQHTPAARVYRAFNNYGWENLVKPMFDGTPGDLFYCGTDGDARAVVEQLIAAAGLRPVYIGGVEQADLVDAVLKLWFALAHGQNKGRHLAFRVLAG